MEANGPIVNSLPYFVYTTQHACPDTRVLFFLKIFRRNNIGEIIKNYFH